MTKRASNRSSAAGAGVEDPHAAGCAVLRHQHSSTRQYSRTVTRRHAREAAERQLDVRARGVAAGVEDARAAVGALAAERDVTLDAVEGHAEAHQVGDALRRLARQDAGGLFVDEAGAGGDRVAQVQLRRVVRPDGRGDAALGVLRVALVDGALGEDEDAAVVLREQRREQPGDAGPDDNVIVLRHDSLSPQRAPSGAQ